MSLDDEFVTALLMGISVRVIGAAGPGKLFDAAAIRLAAARTRVMRVRPPYRLLDFMGQISPGHQDLSDTGLQQGFRALTVRDAACDRIALLVEDAHLMPRATLLYLALALRAGPDLHVALAGSAALDDTLALDGFRELGERLKLRLVLADLKAGRPRGLRARWRIALKTAAIAAGLAVVVWRGYPTAVSLAGLALPDPGIAHPVSRIVPAARSLARPVMEPPLTPSPITTEPPPQAPARPARLDDPPSNPKTAGVEALAARPSTAKQNQQRCREIALHVQLGDNLNDADQNFLRKGCR